MKSKQFEEETTKHHFQEVYTLKQSLQTRDEEIMSLRTEVERNKQVSLRLKLYIKGVLLNFLKTLNIATGFSATCPRCQHHLVLMVFRWVNNCLPFDYLE